MIIAVSGIIGGKSTKKTESDTEIKSVVESFITNSYNLGISDYDTSLIDPESKTFLEYFELRNRYREESLASAGVNKENYEHISKKIEFNKIKIEKDVAYVNITEDYTSIDNSVLNDPSKGSGQDEFDIVLRKVDNKWKINACKSYDEVSNEYDRKVKIEELTSLNGEKAKLDLDKLKKEIEKNSNF